MIHSWLSLFLSWALISFGQPHCSAALSIAASLIGFALFWKALISRWKGKKARFWGATLWFSAVQLVQLGWLASPKYQGIYIFFVYVGLAIWLGCQFGLVSLFLPKRLPISWDRILLLTGAWTLCEWSRLFVFCGFVWNPLGLTLSASPLSAQGAALFGVFGLSFWVVLVNALALNVLCSFRAFSFGIWAFFAAIPYLWGGLHLSYHKGKRQLEKRNPVGVALVQPALFPDEKSIWQGHAERFVPPFAQWERILDALDNAEATKNNVDLIGLPEAAVVFAAYQCVYPYDQVVHALSKRWGENGPDLAPLLKAPLANQTEKGWFVSNAFWAQALANYYEAEIVMGLESLDRQKGEAYNAAFHFLPHTSHIRRYEKQILLPIAEYLPLKILRPIAARYGMRDFFTPGKGAKVFGNHRPLSISICYEECFGHRMREGKKKGAQMLVNVTNDGWYPGSGLPKQHFAHSYLRTIENGLPLVRALQYRGDRRCR